MNLMDLEVEFREKHVPQLEAHFRGIVYAQIDAIEELLADLANIDVVSLPDAFFQKLEDCREVIQPLNNLSEVTELSAIFEHFPELVVLPVTERHLNWAPGDALLVKASKLVRQLKFRLGKKEQERTFEYRYLVGTAFAEYNFLGLQWQKTLFGIITNMLVMSKVIALNLYSNNGEEKAITTLIEAHRNLLAEFKSKLEQQIEKLFQDFSDRVIKELQIAGTAELSRSAHSKELFMRKVQAFAVDAKESAEIWSELIAVNTDQLKAAATLINLNRQLNGYEDALEAYFESKLTQQILPHFERLRKHLQSNLEALEGNATITKTKLGELCKDVTDTTHTIVNEDLIVPITKSCDRKELSSKLDTFASDVALLANVVEEKITLVEELKFNEQLPEYELKPIQWQSLFRRILGDEYLSELLAEDIQPEREVQFILEDFSEVDQIITTNLAIAQDVEKTEDEAPYEIVKKGLELALMKLDEIGEDVPKIERFLSKELEKHQQELSDRISKLLIDQDAGQIKREDAKIKVKQSASDFREKLVIFWAKFVDQLEIGRRFAVSKFGNVNEAVRSFLGLVESEHINVQKTNIAALLHDIDLKYRQLPYIYRRLFDFKRTADASFFVKHHAHFETVSRAYELWKSDFPSSIAILGEKGSGRTTALNYLKAEIFTTGRVEQINLNKTISEEADLISEFSKQLKVSQKKSAEELIALLSRRRKKTVIIVENLQNCFLRTVSGYEAINTLLYLIAETKDNVLWVCSCSKYAWNFLNVALKIGDYFSHSIMVDTQPASNISEVIQRRQIASGYQLEIVPDETTKNSRAFKKLADDEEKQNAFLLEVLFERLNKMAEGNVTVAMIYWIRCIQKIESAEIYIELQENTGIEYLSDLDSETLFVLAAFVLHDVLTAEHLGKCMNYSVKNAETIISRLASRGLLVHLENGYGLNDLIYRQVVRLLSSRNFINA